jgi:hypothetical protein
MEIPQLQWSGATVADGVLVVEIVGDRPKGWKTAFERTAKLLDMGRWGDLRLKGAKVRVGGVDEGDEESLHHFLESVMLEANKMLVAEADDDDAPDTDASADEDDEADADARMTERFREYDSA